jgi:uncharacterized protein (UPF0332 family)
VTAEEKSLQKIRLQQAEETLADCRGMLKIGGSGRSIINRAYYAAYYAILALLVAAEETPRRHNHAISLFDRLYVKTGKLSKATSIQIHQLFESRLEEDYKSLKPVTEADAVNSVRTA